jgi:hypothetical protein
MPNETKDYEAMRDELSGVIQQAENTWQMSGAGTNDERLKYIANDALLFLRAHFPPQSENAQGEGRKRAGVDDIHMWLDMALEDWHSGNISDAEFSSEVQKALDAMRPAPSAPSEPSGEEQDEDDEINDLKDAMTEALGDWTCIDPINWPSNLEPFIPVVKRIAALRSRASQSEPGQDARATAELLVSRGYVQECDLRRVEHILSLSRPADATLREKADAYMGDVSNGSALGLYTALFSTIEPLARATLAASPELRDEANS